MSNIIFILFEALLVLSTTVLMQLTITTRDPRGLIMVIPGLIMAIYYPFKWVNRSV